MPSSSSPWRAARSPGLVARAGSPGAGRLGGEVVLRCRPRPEHGEGLCGRCSCCGGVDVEHKSGIGRELHRLDVEIEAADDGVVEALLAAAVELAVVRGPALSEELGAGGEFAAPWGSSPGGWRATHEVAGPLDPPAATFGSECSAGAEKLSNARLVLRYEQAGGRQEQLCGGHGVTEGVVAPMLG